jgi:hypothetical protein
VPLLYSRMKNQGENVGGATSFCLAFPMLRLCLCAVVGVLGNCYSHNVLFLEKKAIH